MISTFLPFELLVELVDYLDAITLISFSQACKTFRQAVKPNQDDFIQRLLLLEITDAGGTTLSGRWPGMPAWPNGAFDLCNPYGANTRYACVGCMKLRPVHYFGLGSIGYLGMRKPTPTSRAANACRLPDDLGKRKAAKQTISLRNGDKHMKLWHTHQSILEWCLTKKYRVKKKEIREFGSASGCSTPLYSPEWWLSLGEDVAAYLYDEAVGMFRDRRICMECQLIHGAVHRRKDHHSPRTARELRLLAMGRSKKYYWGF